MPFTVEQFFRVFEAYNSAIWPAHILFYLMGVIAVILALKGGMGRSRAAALILSVFWTWMGIFYHIVFFSRISKPATTFGILFIIQGLLIAFAGAMNAKLRFRFEMGISGVCGWVLILYAMIFYHIIGFASGHSLGGSPIFGVAPCPTTIFTLGIFMWAARPIPWYLLVIPLLWSGVGTSAAISLQVPQDYGLGIAGIAGLIIIVLATRKLGPAKREMS